MPFLGRLLETPAFSRTDAFSGIPSTTTAFQAGLFYGLRHPDIPGFSWLDRERWEPVRMASPKDAVRVEERLVARAGPGLFEGGTTYLSILRGGARNFGSTAGLWPLLSGPRLPPLIPGDFVGGVWVHVWTALRVFLRAVTETPFLLGDMVRFSRRMGTRTFEGNYLLNHLVVANLLQEMGRNQVLFDLVRGVPRMFHCIHDFDEVAHRRGPAEAMETLGRIDRRVEHLVAVAASVPDPPDVWILTDHGQIPCLPFDRLFGLDLEAWFRSHRESRLPRSVPAAVGVSPGDAGRDEDLAVVDSGNYAHVYLSRRGPLLAEEIVGRHASALARALDCPGVGLVAMRSNGGAIAFAGGRRVDPSSPATHPLGVDSMALHALLQDLPRTPSSGDMVVFGSWMSDECVSFTSEFSAHGGLSREETRIFLVHPSGMNGRLSQVAHGADLFALFSPMYGNERHPGAR